MAPFHLLSLLRPCLPLGLKQPFSNPFLSPESRPRLQASGFKPPKAPRCDPLTFYSSEAHIRDRTGTSDPTPSTGIVRVKSRRPFPSHIVYVHRSIVQWDHLLSQPGEKELSVTQLHIASFLSACVQTWLGLDRRILCLLA